MAAGDLTTLANVEAWLGLPAGNQDEALLARLITAASGFVRAWCSRDFVSQTYTETRDGNGGRRMMPANAPVTAVSTLAIDGVAIPAGAAPATPGYVITPTALVLIGHGFTRGLANVTVTYTAGYAAGSPELMTIEQACIELIAFRYREMGRTGLASKAMAGETTAFVVKDVPPSVATLLERYKKVVPV